MRVLEEVKRLALELLGGLPASLYADIEEALQTAVRDDDGRDAPQLLYQNQASLWVLRQHHAAHVMRFRQNVGQGFDEFRALRIRNRGELPLGLIDESQIDFHLAGQNLAESLGGRFQPVLDQLRNRLQVVTTVLGLPPIANPVGPQRLADAFVETFTDEQIPAALRALLFGHYERELGKVLGDFYAQVNALLARNGYGAADAQPANRPAPRPRPAPPQPATGEFGAPGSGYADGHGYAGGTGAGAPGQGGGWGGGAGYGGAATGGGYDAAGQVAPGAGAPGTGAQPAGGMQSGAGAQPGTGAGTDQASPTSAELGELRQMLHAWRDGRMAQSTPASPSADIGGARRELRVDEVVSVASLLQGEPSDVFARALAGSGRLASAIRDQINDGSRRLGLDPERTRFSSDEEDAIDLVALLFDSLFQSHHLQERARRLYARLVLPFVKVALTDQNLFVQPEHPARRLLDAITEACAGNKGETPQERELLDRAAAASQRVVAEYNEDLAIFETAHAELDALLQQQRRRIELQAERAAKATFGRERLARAREQADVVLARRLAAPPLSRGIAEFLSGSWRHHLVQVLLREGADSERYRDATALGDALVDADRLAAEGRGRDLAARLLALQPAIIACLGSSGLDHSAAEHGLAVLVKGLIYPHAPRDLHEVPPGPADDDDAERGLWVAGGTDTLRFDPAMADRMRQLEPGDWLQLTDIQGEGVDAKVAWVSPLTSRRLLVNRRGMRVLVASAEELASLHAAGRLQLGCEPTAFEQAMRQVRQQLDRAVGQH
ncbi:hypothetical protein N799_02890 [Lysobacter arseniciresistens ZS79]|uniref:Thymidine phosphorylase n=1 Tax=Lysobacter arseniciresistens ZS79 TaxID=913325 RepID=A0A0A0F287_9GAMM|nr:DUF1631 family protein [Lysobacter arseniciresistens]KGM56675.1 hypothetical protein N799_02890 [Lysobacter arseniciresistens ZS79]